MVQNSSFMVGLSDSFLGDLGKVIAAWSHVEWKFDLLFLSLVVMQKSSGSMKDPRVKLMKLPFKDRLNRFLDRLKELDLESEKMNNLESLAAHLLDCQQERNKIAHAGWYPAMDRGQFVEDQATLWSRRMT